ncbi:tetratricopeptide repeat protein [Clostridium paraputrificum]|uniref:tetratricopeptide repeat protein n=1 Tax=Clostridium paraputrificum TaxID=29363 RepID=UPI003D34E75D
MSRVKLPGSLKVKKILLSILVVVAIGVVVKVGIDNRREKETNEKIISEEIADRERIKKEEEEIRRALEEKEEALYSEAYNSFFGELNYKDTIDKANILIQEFPQSYKGYNIRGIAKAYNGSFEDGMQDIEKALELKDDYGYARFNKALNYELYNRLDDALIWYDKALEVEEYIWSHYGKASIYGRRGDVENTVSNLKKAIDLAAKSGQDQGVKEEAKTEHDFDPVRGKSEFEDLINS